MIEPQDLENIQGLVQEFLTYMVISDFTIQVTVSPEKEDDLKFKDLPNQDVPRSTDSVDVAVTLPEPQFLIGENGKTLLDVQRVLRIMLNKKMGKMFYVKVDINGYRAKKIEYLKKMANEMADQAVTAHESKALPPMSSYERRIIHAELAQRQDVRTQSQGEGFDRSVTIVPK